MTSTGESLGTADAAPRMAGVGPGVEARTRWLFVLPFFLMTPLLALSTMDPQLAPSAMRTFSIPVLAAELAVILLVMQRTPPGRSLYRQISLPARILAVLWILAMGVSAIGAQYDPSGAQFHFLLKLLHGFFGVALWSQLSAEPHLRRQCLVAVAAGLGSYAVIAYGFALWNAAQPDFPWSRFGVGVTNIRHVGYLSLGLTGIAAGLWVTAAKGRDEVLPATLFFLGCFLLMWSGGRGAFIALMIHLAVLLTLASPGRRLSLMWRLLAVLVVATMLAGIYVPNKHFGPLNIFLRFDASTLPGEEYSSGRTEMWRQTADWITRQPWFGYGEGQYRYAVPAARGFSNHPHNLPLQLLMQWGVVGTAMLTALLVRLGWKALPLLKAPTALTYPCTAIVTGLLAVSMVDGPFFYALPVVIFLLAIATLLAEAQDHRTFRK